MKSDGTVQNKSYSTIGYIRNDGTVQKQELFNNWLCKDVKEWAAVTFFF